MATALMKGSIAALALTVFAVAGPSALADDDAPLSELLVEKGLITQEELDAARAEADADESAASAKQEKSGPKVSVGVKGVSVTSPDERFGLNLGGRIQLDAGGFSGGITPLGSGMQLRRGRIVVSGHVWDDWKYKFEVDFGGNGNAFPTDVWLSYDGFDRIIIKVGHQKVPFSQSSMSSSNWQVFQERALADGLIDTGEEGRRRLGATVANWGDYYNFLAGVFGEGLSDPGRPDTDWGTAARLQIVPIATETRVAAFGGSVYYRSFTSASALRYDTRPESNLASVNLIDTGTIAIAKDTFSYNAEATAVFDGFHAQAEYTHVRVNRNFGASPLSFDGWYVQGGVFLTGESRNFNRKTGKFGRIKPARKIGAWEVAVRYSIMDLESQDIRGGREHNVTFALNWWANQNVMFRFNYVRANLEPNSTALFTLTPPLIGGVNESLNAFMARAQIVF